MRCFSYTINNSRFFSSLILCIVVSLTFFFYLATLLRIANSINTTKLQKYNQIKDCPNNHSLRSIWFIKELAVSFPVSCSTKDKANSKAVPGPRLVVTLPNTHNFIALLKRLRTILTAR